MSRIKSHHTFCRIIAIPGNPIERILENLISPGFTNLYFNINNSAQNNNGLFLSVNDITNYRPLSSFLLSPLVHLMKKKYADVNYSRRLFNRRTFNTHFRA